MPDYSLGLACYDKQHTKILEHWNNLDRKSFIKYLEDNNIEYGEIVYGLNTVLEKRALYKRFREMKKRV